MTNFEKIKNMNVEELAEMFSQTVHFCCYCPMFHHICVRKLQAVSVKYSCVSLRQKKSHLRGMSMQQKRKSGLVVAQ